MQIKCKVNAIVAFHFIIWFFLYINRTDYVKAIKNSVGSKNANYRTVFFLSLFGRLSHAVASRMSVVFVAKIIALHLFCLRFY